MVNVSRRHAEIRCEGARYVLRDLGSTNGTFVNGERIAGDHVLEPGDRIDISACMVMFCLIDADVDALADAAGNEKTILFERPAAREAFHGDLAEIPPFALLQVLEMGCKSGVLSIDAGDATGRIWLTRGAPLHAETEKQSGLDAALSLVAAEQGRFRFEPGEPEMDATIEASVTELLLESSRLLDEGAR